MSPWLLFVVLAVSSCGAASDAESTTMKEGDVAAKLAATMREAETAAAGDAAATETAVKLDKTAVRSNVTSVMSDGRSKDMLPVQRYDGHVLLKVVPTSEEQVEALRALFHSGEIDEWKTPVMVGEDVQFLVPPAGFNWTTSYLKGNDLKYEVAIENVQRILDSDVSNLIRGPAQFGWNSYHRLGTIYSWMQDLVQRFPKVASLVIGGISTEGRQIVGVRIAHGENLPIIYLEGGIHGREFISPAAATYILDQLLTSEDAEVQRAARSFEWHIFPSVNPDAYEYCHTTDRLWRKSRRRTSFLCWGVDLNRNFRAQWGVVGVSWNFCSHTFPGTRAESEVETRSRVKYIEPLLPRTKAFLALHSYGQYLLYPWGFTRDTAPNHGQLMRVASKTAGAFSSRHGNVLKVGPLAQTLYPASGCTMDWMYSRGVPFSYTLELRDTGRYGFLLPSEQIPAAVEETLAATIAMANAVLDELKMA